MENEYKILKCFQKSGDFSSYPNKEQIESLLLEILPWESIAETVNILLERNLIENKNNQRIGLSAEGFTYLDTTYYLEQAYEMVDNGLLKIQTRNDFIEENHIRSVHRIEQEARNIFEDYSLRKILNPSKPHFSNSEITRNGRNVIEYGGIKNYIDKINKEKKIRNSAQTNKEDLVQKINELTLAKLKSDNENSDLKTELAKIQLELARTQKEDIPINAIDRKTVVVWQIIAAICAITAILLAVLK